MSKISRRDFVKLMGAGGALSAFGLTGCETTPKVAEKPAKSAPRVVVVGGGFGGATCAKYLRLYDPGLNVTLVEQNASYVTCPGSNWMLGGLRTIEDLTQNYNTLRVGASRPSIADFRRGMRVSGRGLAGGGIGAIVLACYS